MTGELLRQVLDNVALPSSGSVPLYPPQIVAIEGLDGAGKTTVVSEIVKLTNGIDVSKALTDYVRTSYNRKLLNLLPLEARYRYWLWINYSAGAVAVQIVARGHVAVLDSYVFRTLVTHGVAGADVGDRKVVMSTMIRPHRAVLLTVDEPVRRSRVRARDGHSQSSWHEFVDDHAERMLARYREFGLAELDTTVSPAVAAVDIMSRAEFERFDFA
jgi:thymidylate kinase